MKKTFVSIVVLAALSGCTSYTDSMAIAKQDYACRNNGGVYDYGSFSIKLECMDGTLIDGREFMSVKLPPEFYPKKEH